MNNCRKHAKVMFFYLGWLTLRFGGIALDDYRRRLDDRRAIQLATNAYDQNRRGDGSHRIYLCL